MQYLYPALIDIALDKGQPDVDQLVDQLNIVTMNFVEEKIQASSQTASVTLQSQMQENIQDETRRYQITLEVYQYLVAAFRDIDGEFNDFLSQQLIISDEEVKEDEAL